MAKRLRWLLLLACLDWAGGLGCGAQPRSSVVMITIDTLCADHLGCYGYFRDTAPFLCGLAADGVLFERAITTMATTLPAHTSLMTSAYPARHGVLSNLNFYRQTIVTDGGFQTAAQMFRQAGYGTAALVSSPVLSPETGSDAGFEVFDSPLRVRDAFETTRSARARRHLQRTALRPPDLQVFRGAGGRGGAPHGPGFADRHPADDGRSTRAALSRRSARRCEPAVPSTPSPPPSRGEC